MIKQHFVIKFVAYALGVAIPLVIYEAELFTVPSIWLALIFVGAFGAISEAGGILEEPNKLQIFLNGASVILFAIVFYSIIYPIIERGTQPFFGPFIMSFTASIVSVGWFLIPIGGIIALSANELNLYLEKKSANK